MTESTTSAAPGQPRLCQFCKERPAICKGACLRCYKTHVNPPKKKEVGVCCVCGKVRTLFARGMCSRDYNSPNRELGEKGKGRQERKFTPEEISEARKVEDIFLNEVVTVVKRLVSSQFRFKRHHDQEEIIAEVTALAWKKFIREVAAGRNVLDTAFLVAKDAMGHFRKCRRLTGNLSCEDVMSPRLQRDQEVRVLLGDEDFKTFYHLHYRKSRVMNPAIIHEHLENLPEKERLTLTALFDGESTTAISEKFGISKEDQALLVEELIEALS